MGALSNHFNSWVMGELVGYADMLELQETVMDAIGLQARDLLGELSFNSTGQPLTVTTNGAGTVFCGGSTLGNQSAYLLGRWCPEVTPASFSVPANSSGSFRIDLICAQPNEVLVYSFTRSVRQPDGSIVPTTCYQIQFNATWQYVQGSSPTTPPAVPSGFVEVAKLNVPTAGQGPLQSQDITMELPTLETVINSYVTPGGVTSLNSKTGPVTLNNLDGAIGIEPYGTYGILLSNYGVTSVNALTGNVTAIQGITSVDGSVTVADDNGPVTDLSVKVVTNAAGTPVVGGRIGYGQGTTDGSGNFTLTLPSGYVIQAIQAISYDPTNAHAVGFRTVTGLGSNSVTIRSCEYHDAPPQPVANIPFNFIVIFQT